MNKIPKFSISFKLSSDLALFEIRLDHEYETNFLFYNLFLIRKKTKVFHDTIFRFFPFQRFHVYTQSNYLWLPRFNVVHVSTVTSFLLHMNYNFLPHEFRFSIEFMAEIQNSISSEPYPSIELSDNRLKLLIHMV